MRPEPATCSLCGLELTRHSEESRSLELKANGRVAAVCAECYDAIGDDGDDEFLEFLLSA